MVEIVYEYANNWPEAGPLKVNVPAMTLEIPVSPEQAQRRANGYIGMHIGVLMGSSDPRLVISETPAWKLAVNLHLPTVGYVGQVGTIYVNAITGEVIAPSPSTIHAMQGRASELAQRYTPTTTTAV